MSAPWMKFYPTDWRGDPALRMCSLAARGLWLEMLCIMHESDPYGYLLVKGTPVSAKQLALLAGSSLRDVSRCLDELRAAHVFDIENGVILSRRMVRDRQKALRDKENGGKGGNPKLIAKEAEGVNPPDNGQDKAQIPESRDKNKTVIPFPSETGADAPSATDRLWSDGVATLIALGAPSSSVRSMIGKWRRGNPDEAIMAAIDRAHAENVFDPIPWVNKALSKGGAPPGLSKAQAARERFNADVFDILNEVANR